MNRSSFTLIELLVVVAVVAILSVVVVLVLQPQELLKQGRDGTRVSDLNQLNKALGLYQTDSGGSGSFGTANVLYVSLPDPTATSTTLGNSCTSLGLPSLPSGWTYHCSASSTYQKVDGTGWIPVNFSSLTFTNPLGQLPTDPVNNGSSTYYTYAINSSNQWEMNATFESAKYRLGGSMDKASTDGGINSVLYEKGSNLSLNPLNDNGLVGWWKFDEGTGASTTDSSGSGNTGTLTNGPTWVTGKVGSAALSFDGTNDYVAPSSMTTFTNASFSIVMWFKATTFEHYVFGAGIQQNNRGLNIMIRTNGLIHFGFVNDDLNSATGLVSAGQWYHLVTVYNFASDISTIYGNGIAVASGSQGPFIESNPAITIGKYTPGSAGESWDGLLDDVRVYNRTLSAAEIMAIYNATR